MLKFVIFTGLLGCALAACPLFDPVPTLNLANQIGTWQVHGVLRPLGKIKNYQCVMLMISGENLGVQPVNLTGHATGKERETGEELMIHSNAQVLNLQRPGRWNIVTGGLTSIGYVLYSDYVEYSLLATCGKNADDVDEINVFFLSRLHDPIPDPTKNNFLAMLLRDYGINGDNYVSVFHDHSCGH